MNKIPKHIVNKIIRANEMAQKKKLLMAEVEDWMTSKGIDVDEYRTETFSVLEHADYGELNPNDYDSLGETIIKDIEEIREYKSSF